MPLIWGILILLLPILGYSYKYPNYTIKEHNIKSPYEYNASSNNHQNWCIVKNKYNLVFIANQTGLLIYDGIEWRKIAIPNKSVRSLVLTKSGRLYIGGRNEFGYLAEDLTYVSLSKSLSKELRNFSYVWQTIKDKNDNIYFRTSKYLFKYINKKLHTYIPKTSINGLYNVGENALYHERSIGLFKIENFEHKTFWIDESLLNDKIYFINKLATNSFILGIKSKGLYQVSDKNSELTCPKISTSLAHNKLYFSTTLSDNLLAIATLRNGITLLNLSDHSTEIINEQTGLSDNNVKHLYIDHEKKIWASLNSGITTIDTQPSLNFYPTTYKILDINKNDGNLQFGTTKGFIEQSEIRQIKNNNKTNNIEENCWSIKTINDQTIIGTENGLIDKETKKLIHDRAIFNITPSSFCKRIWCSSRNEFTSFVYNYNGIRLEHSYKEITIPVRTIVEESHDTLWLGTLTSGIYRLKFKIKNDKIDYKTYSVKRFRSSSGLPKGEINVYNIANHIIFATRKGIYKFDEKSERFVPDDTLGKEFCDGSRNVFRLAEDKKGNIWIYSEREYFKAEPLGNGKYKIISKPFKAFPRVQTNVIYPDGDIIWFGTNEGLIRYDTTVKKDYNKSFNTLITRMASGEEELFLGYTMDNKEEVSLPWEKRDLWFTYASPYFEHEEKTTYQYRLTGSSNEEWSPWERKTKKEFSNLDPGRYILEARGRNVYETIGKTAKFRFRILPPWYRTWWAWSIWTLIFMGFVYLLIRLRSLKLLKEKEALEEIVKERTTEVREKNLLLENQADQLMEMDRIKSSFFANISHEFRTPLTLITGPMEELLKSKRSSKEQETMQMILRNSRQLLSLINQLLDLSKLENSTLGLSPSVENITRFVRDIMNTFRASADISGKTLSLKTEDENLRFAFDREKLRQIIVNLLSNAMKFTETGATISARIGLLQENFVKIEVEDTGTGIDENDLERIFDRFYQSENGKDFGGTGIGLALSRELARLHGGDISVESQKGKGSLFTVILPVTTSGVQPVDKTVEEEEFSADLPEIEHDAEDTDSTDTNNLPLLLVVDDNKDIRNFIKSSLSSDFRIVEAENGEKGVETANNIIPDIIISDVMMPVMDGYQFVSSIKKSKNTCHIPVIMLTAKASEESEMEGLSTGAEDYVRKPFNADILKTKCLNLIRLRSELHRKLKNEMLMQPAEIEVSSMDDEFLKEVHNIIEQNLSDPEFNVEQLCKKLYMSRTTVYRKIQALTGETPTQFVRAFRIRRGAQLIKAKAGTITEIAFMTGFSSSAYFTKCFKEIFHQLPSEYE